MAKKVKRLYSEFKPDNYRLFLDIDREKAVFSGNVKISGQKVGRPSQRITLHQKGLRIKSAKITRRDKKTGSVEIDISRINTHSSFDELRLHAKQILFPGEYHIEIEFSGNINQQMHGIYPCNFELNGKNKQLIATQFESHHAREAFPCVDEPEAKATFSLSLATPKGETVISNTPAKGKKPKAKQIITNFEETPRMSTYLLAFAYGELSFKEAKTSNGIVVRVYATPDKVEMTDFALDVSVRCLEFFEKYYGVAYPLAKLDLIGLPDFSAGAMENWGLITFRESLLYVQPKSSSVETKQFVAMVICHEIAHQWFGNLVTMKWWNDLWLNESFANLMEYRAVDELFPEWNIWEVFVQRELNSAFSRDALPNVQPVQVEVNHPDELASVFDPSIVYAKGGSLLNMVRHFVGEQNFRKGLKNYFEEYSYGNTVADDLWRHMEKTSSIPITKIMDNWLRKPGFPVIEVSYDSAKQTFSASQQRLVLGGVDKDHTLWQLPLAASAPLDEDILQNQQQTFSLTKKSNYPLTLNHDGKSYLISQYQNPDHFALILKAAQKDILSSIDRLLLVQNYLLLERATRVSTLQNLELFLAFSNEKEEAVWSALAGIIGGARTLIDKSKYHEEKLNALVRPVVEPLASELGWSGAKNQSAQTLKLRSLMLSMSAVAENKSIIKEGLERFREYKVPADLAPDIRSVVYFIGTRYGTDKDFNKLLKLHNSVTNADEKDEVTAGLTTTHDPDKIKMLLSMMTGDNVRLQDTATWFAWLIRNRYSREQTWQWLVDNWTWVEDKFGDDKSYDRFARYAANAMSYPAQLEEYKAFFEPKSNIALARSIKLGIEEIESRIAWRQQNEQPIKNWLANQAR
jgi:aminopeptidase N